MKQDLVNMAPHIDHEVLLGENCGTRVVAVRAEHPIKQALEWQMMMAADSALNQTQIAENEGISRARVYQLMRLMSLPKEVQGVLIKLKDPKQISRLSERKMRDIALLSSRERQLTAFRNLVQDIGPGLAV